MKADVGPGKEGRGRVKQSSKTGLSGNRYCRNKSKAIFVKQDMLYTEQLQPSGVLMMQAFLTWQSYWLG